MEIRPLPNLQARPDADLSPWQSGDTKPEAPGLYLRQFDEGEGVTEFRDGQWLRDGFFPSDVQRAPWRGLAA